MPTTGISLVREHTQQMQLPRFLWVPFELGRPFGAPNEPDFQRCVLRTALELLERKDLDVVCIATPPHWHALVCIAAAQAGKHIFCEKPIALCAAENCAWQAIASPPLC